MIQTAEAKQVCRAASAVLFPELEFGVKPCGKYTREDFQEILSRIAFDQELANTGGKTLQLDRDEHVDITATLEIRSLNRCCTTCAIPHQTPSLTSSMASEIECSKSPSLSANFLRSSMLPSISTSGASTGLPTQATS